MARTVGDVESHGVDQSEPRERTLLDAMFARKPGEDMGSYLKRMENDGFGFDLTTPYMRGLIPIRDP